MGKSTMNRIAGLLAAVAAAAVVLPGVGLAGPPAVTQEPGQLCGIEGTWANRIVVDSEMQSANGVTISHFHGSSTFTSAATQKSIEFLVTGSDRTSFVDNGDGTYSIVTEHSGSGIVIKAPNGGTLTTNAGAGHWITEDVFVMPAGGLAAANPDVDQYVTTRGGRVGGRATSDGGDFCADLVIPAIR
jgi:nitrous oxidase accessory protein NosD